jgi:hypothetical protein
MTTNTQPTDFDFLASLGTMRRHELEAVDALYPDAIEKAVEHASAQFDGIPTDAESAKQLGAIVIAELFSKLGTKDADVAYRVNAAKDEATAWVAKTKSGSPAPAHATKHEADPFPAPGRLPSFGPGRG